MSLGDIVQLGRAIGEPKKAQRNRQAEMIGHLYDGIYTYPNGGRVGLFVGENSRDTHDEARTIVALESDHDVLYVELDDTATVDLIRDLLTRVGKREVRARIASEILEPLAPRVEPF